MNNLNEVLPRSDLMSRFPRAVFDEYGKTALLVLTKKEPGKVFSLAANVWNRIIQKKWHSVHPKQFATYFDKKDPKLHVAISEYLGIEIIHDLYYVKGWQKAPKTNANLIVEMFVARVYRDDLQLVDINFRDPAQPIREEDRKDFLQSHRGFGLLRTVVANLERKARELNCEQLTLTAGTRNLAGLFQRYGFSVEDSHVGRLGMANGLGIPMERDLTK